MVIFCLFDFSLVCQNCQSAIVGITDLKTLLAILKWAISNYVHMIKIRRKSASEVYTYNVSSKNAF